VHLERQTSIFIPSAAAPRHPGLFGKVDHMVCCNQGCGVSELGPLHSKGEELMQDPTSPLPRITQQGVALVDLVIERVRAAPYAIAGICGDYPLAEPHPLAPTALERLTLPSGKPLPPSLKRWLAFDASWLAQFGWLSSLDEPRLTPRRLDEVVADGIEYPGWAKYYVRLGDHFDECFLLPPFSGETCRLLVMSEPDDWGEHPILEADVDDVPLLDLAYPGLDVYLASIVGLAIPHRRDANVTSTTLFAVPLYRQRLTTHAQHLFGGQREVLVDPHRPEGYEWLPLGDEEAETESLDRDDGHPQEGDEFPF